MSRDDRPRYYRERRTRAFWEPGEKAKALGFAASVPLGDAGPEAMKRAIDWNARLDAAREDKREGREGPRPYPKGSLGAFYMQFRTTEAWAQMEPTSRLDYERTWPHIEKRFGHTFWNKITPDDSERFHVDIHPRHDNARDPEGKLKLPWNTAHRTLKVWRSLLTALVDYRIIPPPAPIGRVSNPMPPGRSQTWTPEEVPALIAAASRLKLHGIALAVRLIYDGTLSPVDGRLVKLGAWRQGADGAQISTRRKKTDKPVHVAMTEDATTAVATYLAILAGAGIELTDDDYLIRDASLDAYEGYNGRKRFERDFRKAREAAFPGDRRQMLDLRRTGLTEALIGGADERDIAKSAANRLDKDDKLAATYLTAPSRRVQTARKAGREKLTGKPKGDPS